MPVTTVGSEILVNTTTPGNQSDPQVTTLSGGRFVVTWTDASATGGDTSLWAIRAQVFEAGGSPVGGEILVNSATNSIQMSPQITALSTGGFAIAWLDFSWTAPDNAGTAVRAQVFSAGGTPVGTEILANTTTAGDQNAPQLAGLAGGGFVITWQDSSQSGGDSDGIAVKGQVFAANGARVGTEFLVNTTTTGNQLAPHVTGLSGGGFVITWDDQSETGDDTNGSAVRAQVFLADGTPSGGEILVNTATTGSQNEIQLTALSGGGFAIAWTDNSGTGGDTSGQAVRAQAFSAAGARVGGEILVNSTTDSSQSRPAIESLSNGGFVVAWNDASLSGGDTDFYAVRAQVFGAAGTPVGTEILVNTTTERGQFNAQIAPLPDGGFVIVFEDSSESSGDTDGMAVRAQAFSAMGAPIGTEVLVNTTTAGNQNAVQITALPDGGFAIAWADGSQSGGDTSGGAIRAQLFSSGTGAPPPAAPDPAPTPAAGGAGDDLASLDANPNTYAAGGGNDWAFAGRGDDTIQGNAGNDTLYGDDGNDLVYGGKDNDQVYGGLGDDRLYGDL
ncbi:MAG: hypothetical protein ABW360_14845, partial [Phenylobacterium sp.]